MNALLAVSLSNTSPLALVATVVILVVVLAIVASVQFLIHNAIQYVRKVSGKSYEITAWVKGL